MSFTPLFMPQRSAEWYQARLGLLTGSCADAVIAERKRGTGELQARAQLRRRLVCERLTGLSSDGTYQSDDMQRGNDLEPLAFAAYEARAGQIVQRVGFVKHDVYATGCSPDGFVGEWEGLIELKCPKSTTHLEYLQAGVLPSEYRGQILHALWLTGAQWCDFCSFDDRFPDGLELFVYRVPRVEFDVLTYETTALKFLEEVGADLAAVERLLVGAAA